MPKQISPDIFDSIVKTLSHYQDGAKLADLLKDFPKIPRRTLQRYLSLLVKQKRLNTQGLKRSLVYCNVHSIQAKPFYYEAKSYQSEKFVVREDQKKYIKQQDEIPLSKEALIIKRYVNQPLIHRKPQNYHRQFLDQYRPNETTYLTESIRKHLKKIGTPSEDYSLAGTFTKRILNRLLIDLSWNSSRLEGNTFSLLETERLLNFGESFHDKTPVEIQMIMNHKAAIEFLVELGPQLGFKRSIILNLHAFLADNLLDNPRACGQIRTIPVGIGKTVYHPLEIPQLINECFQQILDTAEAIHNPFEQAFFIMVHLPYLQAFEDINKRVSRLSANIPFIKNNLCPLSFIDVPTKDYIDGILGVYEKNEIELLRDIFVWAYERSCANYIVTRNSLGTPDLFRLQYQNEIFTLIHKIIERNLDSQQAANFIRQYSNNMVAPHDQEHFIEATDKELIGLHEGNYARFQVTQAQFETWYQQWKKPREA